VGFGQKDLKLENVEANFSANRNFDYVLGNQDEIISTCKKHGKTGKEMTKKLAIRSKNIFEGRSRTRSGNAYGKIFLRNAIIPLIFAL